MTNQNKAQIFDNSDIAATFRSQMKRLARKLNIVVEFKAYESIGEVVLSAYFYFEHHPSKLDKLNDKLRMQAYLLTDKSLSEVELDVSQMTLDFLDPVDFAQWHLKAYSPRVNYNYYKANMFGKEQLKKDLIANNDFVLQQLKNASINFLESCRQQKKISK